VAWRLHPPGLAACPSWRSLTEPLSAVCLSREQARRTGWHHQCLHRSAVPWRHDRPSCTTIMCSHHKHHHVLTSQTPSCAHITNTIMCSHHKHHHVLTSQTPSCAHITNTAMHQGRSVPLYTAPQYAAGCMSPAALILGRLFWNVSIFRNPSGCSQGVEFLEIWHTKNAVFSAAPRPAPAGCPPTSGGRSLPRWQATTTRAHTCAPGTRLLPPPQQLGVHCGASQGPTGPIRVIS
jgi:hypothetical protein